MHDVYEKLEKCLHSSQTLSRHNLSTDEIRELAEYVRKYCVSIQVEEIVRMVEDIIRIDPVLDWKEILEAAAKKIVGFLNAEAASIRVFDPVTAKLVAFGSYQYEETERTKSIPVEKSVAGKVIKSGKSYLVPNIMEEPDYRNKDVVGEYGFNSLMAVPLLIQRFLDNEPDIRGTIQIYYKEKNREFDPLEITNAELLARRVSYVLAKKRILDLQKLNLKKEKIVEKIFVKLSHREGIKMKDVLRMTIPELADIIHIQRCTLFSVTPDRKYVQTELEYPVEREYRDTKHTFAIKDHAYFDILINNTENPGDYENERIEPAYLLIKRPQNSRLLSNDLKQYTSGHNIHSILFIPLKAEDEINHLLVFYALDSREYFSEQEIELLNFLGKEIMKALRIEKLDDVLHDFKNPGIAIAGFARRAKKLLESKTENINDVKDKIADYLDIIFKETVRMQELVIYPNIEGRERVVDLTEILRNRFRINEEAIIEQRRSNIRLVHDDMKKGLLVCCYPFALERVIDNLLDNATKAVPKDGGTLSIKSYQSGEMACFEIRNTGKISEDNIEQIKKGDVKGRGLNIIYRFIEGMQGKIEVSTEDNNTTFRIMIPLCKKEL